jgi:hypothetical protein
MGLAGDNVIIFNAWCDARRNNDSVDCSEIVVETFPQLSPYALPDSDGTT